MFLAPVIYDVTKYGIDLKFEFYCILLMLSTETDSDDLMMIFFLLEGGCIWIN